MNLTAHYTDVVLTLRKQETAESKKAADFVAGQLMDPKVQAEFRDIEETRSDDYELGKRILANGQMQWNAENKGNHSHITVELNANVSTEEAARYFDFSNAVYKTLFGEHMKNTQQNLRSIPRTMEFDADGPLQALFEAWQVNKKPETYRGTGS